MAADKDTNKTDFSTRKLYRSKQNKMISGVCGGIADYLNLDPVIIRILWVVFTLFGGMGLIMYIAGIIVIPENPDEKEPEHDEQNARNDKGMFWGAILIIIGIALILKQFGVLHMHFWAFPWQLIWAVLLILLGLYLLYNKDPFKFLRREENKSEGLENKETTRIFRSRENKMLAGVCAGLAKFFNLDVTVIRLLYVLLTLASVGIGLVAYIIMAIVFPEEDSDIVADNSIERKA